MAITRRQFVTRLGALAAAAGLSQTQIMKVTEALGHSAPFGAGKPKVIWVHGAECTGCSTSLLGLFEDVQGKGVEDKRLITAVDPEGDGLTTLNALDLMVGGDGNGGHIVGPDGAAALAALGITKETGSDHPFGHRTLWENGLDMDANANGDAWNIASIADVLIDFIDLQYHETVMGMGGAMAYEWLMDEMDKYP
ncbi:MAG: twin-arginine translocation signal domain-containing protein, partial [Coriobacteriia bacterium]|nr:twin-arginine translocation signal domain-containing protein [Coriobacteriia bacterium]